MELLLLIVVVLLFRLVFPNIGRLNLFKKYEENIMSACSYIGKNVPPDFNFDEKGSFESEGKYAQYKKEYENKTVVFFVKPDDIFEGNKKIEAVGIMYPDIKQPYEAARRFSEKLKKLGWYRLKQFDTKTSANFTRKDINVVMSVIPALNSFSALFEVNKESRDNQTR